MFDLPLVSPASLEAFDLVAQPVWIFRPDTLVILFANRPALEWIGLSAEELKSLTIADLRPESERAAIRQAVQDFTGPSKDAGRWTILTGSGDCLRASFHWRMVEFDETRAILATIQDITRLDAVQGANDSLEGQFNALTAAGNVALEHFQSLFEAAPGKFLVLSPGSYRIVAVSDEFAEATMTRPETIKGRLLFDVFPDDPNEPGADGVRNLRRSLERVERLKATNTMVLQRHPIRQPNGSFEERYWLPANKPVFSQNGTLLYIIHHVEDVTALVYESATAQEAKLAAEESGLSTGTLAMHMQGLRRALAQLQKQETKLRTAERLLDLGSWEYDLETEVLNWSDRQFELFGIPRSEGPPDFEKRLALVHPNDREEFRQACEEFFESGAPQIVFEHRIMRPDGSTAHVKGVGERHNASEKQIVIGFVQDISEYKELRRELNLAEEMVRIAGEKARLGGWRLELEREKLIWSEETARIHELPSGATPSIDQAIGYYAPEHQERISSAVRRCIETGEPFDEVCELITAKGNRIWVRAIGSAVRDASGAITEIQGAFQDISELRAAEERADEADKQRSRILESISDAFFTLSHDWRFTYLNGRAEELIDRTRKELLGQNIWTEFPQAVGTIFHSEYEYAAAHNETRRFEAFFEPLAKWFDVSAYPTPEGLAVYFRDITDERAKTEQLKLLETSAARLNDILIITEADPISPPDGPRVVYVNDAFERITGYTRAEIIGKTPRILQGSGTDRTELDRIRQALEHGQPIRSELVNYTKFGEELHLELDIVPIANEHGRHTHFVAVERNVTERNRLREAERVNHERFRLVSNATNDAIWDWDLHIDRCWWNDSMATLFGHEPAMLEAGEDSWMHNIHPDDRDRVLENLHRTIDGPDTHWEQEYRFLRGDGSVAIVSDRGFIIRNDRGKAVRMLGSMQDLTEQRHLEQRLRESQKLEAVGQLTGGLAHDFNNLLTVILGNAEELATQLNDRQQLRLMAEMTATAAERGAELTNRLLAFARRQTLKPQIVNLNELTKGMEGLIRRTLSEDIDIRFVQDRDLWLIEADPGQLEVALLNLVINSRDAMPHGGKITIETMNCTLDDEYATVDDEVLPGRYAMVSVSDTGTGMDQNTLLRAFEPFFTTKEIGKGSGLGLSMVFGFVKQSQGHIKMYSEVGEGTAVRIYFRKLAGDGTSDNTGSEPETVVGGWESVLVVEDDDLVRVHLSAQLKGLGYRVIDAKDGPDALEILERSDDIHLLLTDIVMPGGMNGRQLADQVRARRPGMKILFTSGYSENSIIHHGRLDPGVDLLSKPYRRKDLAAKVRKVLDAP